MRLNQNMPVSKKILDDLALSENEYESIVLRLKREPNNLELGLFGSLWSEHCGYKHSKPLLKILPSQGSRVLVELGSENAGAIDIGNDLALVMKIESHNHPSAIEPFQGAATGVGGIIRDVFAMGARPIALLNSLRFGPLEEPRNSYLFDGVVGGISSYGNCVGIPDVGGEINFSKTYSMNPLVNAMCVGIVDKNRLTRAVTGEPGNLLMLVGADTGRDGILGASGLASRTFEEERDLRPTVQVGNPFLEKVLIEACLELIQTDYFVGIQDLGAAGLTSASVEAADKSDCGVEIEISSVPRRDAGMDPYEVMLSESQERMLIVVKDGCEKQVRAIFDKWDVKSTVIGRVTDDGLVRILDKSVVVAEVPVKELSDPPLYKPIGIKPTWLTELQDYNLENVPLPNESANEILLRLLGSHNIASKEWVYRQYDHQVQTNTVIGPGGDAAVLRIKETSAGVALSVDGNGRYCYLDPFVGGMIAVSEACRNVVCTGAEPVALTDCLNFGNPERQQVYYQLEECVKGIAFASRVLETPVISGNVSLYNETQGESIYPTPIIGALGLLENVSDPVDIGFRNAGDIVMLLGASSVNGESTGLSGSEYLEVVHNLVSGMPTIDIYQELALQRTCLSLIKESIVKSAHDCSDGGIAVTLAESCIAGNIGFTGEFQVYGRWDSALFGEYQSRIIMSISPTNLEVFENICRSQKVSWFKLGKVGGDSVKITNLIDLSLLEIRNVWHDALQIAMNG